MAFSQQSSIRLTLQQFVDKPKFDEHELNKLTSVLNIHLFQEVQSDHWELTCNGLICLLYHSLHIQFGDNKSSIISVCKIFKQKWFSNMSEEFPLIVSRQQRISCYGSIILLFHHHFPKASVLEYSKEILKMPNGTISLPSSLSSSLFSMNNHHRELNVLLLNSICCLLKLPDYMIEIENSYHHNLNYFFKACEVYRQNNFNESIHILSKICQTSCSRFMVGWIYSMIGLNYYKLGKYQLALRSCQTSLNQSSNCIISLYISGKCFNILKNYDAEIECLQLFVDAAEADLNTEECLHGILLNYHQPLHHIVSQIKLLLVVSKIKYGKLTANRNLIEILSGIKVCSSIEYPSFLTVTDLPSEMLPIHSIQFLLILLDSMGSGLTIEVFSSLLPIDEINTLESPLEKLSIFAAYALKVEFLKATQIDKAAGLATRLDLLIIGNTSEAKDDSVSACLRAINIFLYNTLINMYDVKGYASNVTYYTKLKKNMKPIIFKTKETSHLDNIYLEIVFNKFIEK